MTAWRFNSALAACSDSLSDWIFRARVAIRRVVTHKYWLSPPIRGGRVNDKSSMLQRTMTNFISGEWIAKKNSHSSQSPSIGAVLIHISERLQSTAPDGQTRD